MSLIGSRPPGTILGYFEFSAPPRPNTGRGFGRDGTRPQQPFDLVRRKSADFAHGPSDELRVESIDKPRASPEGHEVASKGSIRPRSRRSAAGSVASGWVPSEIDGSAFQNPGLGGIPEGREILKSATIPLENSGICGFRISRGRWAMRIMTRFRQCTAVMRGGTLGAESVVQLAGAFWHHLLIPRASRYLREGHAFHLTHRDCLGLVPRI